MAVLTANDFNRQRRRVMDAKTLIAEGKSYLGIEFGSTRIKGVVIDGDGNVLASGGHGWAQIDNKVYDPNWSFIIGDRLCYAVTRAQSGKGRRQPWFACSKYKKDLRK